MAGSIIVGIDFTAGIITGVTTGFVLSIVAWIWQRWIRWVNTEEFKLVLNTSRQFKALGVKFGVLHICNDDGIIINRVHWFKGSFKDSWHVAIRHPRNLGFQYKCFVDYHPSVPTNVVMAKLREEGYIHPSGGAGKQNRVWFIIEAQATTETPEGIINNRFFPE